ncbi:hypothetical protein MW887_011487 [Aspergillus wentii]|nr:hypothetical protein MW887_011487 [Aspergillus wentii]
MAHRPATQPTTIPAMAPEDIPDEPAEAVEGELAPSKNKSSCPTADELQAAGRRSSAGHPSPHGLLLQHPRNVGDVVLHVYQSVVGRDIQTFGKISFATLWLKEAG